jgi:phosphonate transport system permease protein
MTGSPVSSASVIERHPRGSIRLTSSKGQNLAIPLTLLVLVGLTVYTFVRMNYGTFDLGVAVKQALGDLYTVMFQPYFEGHFTAETVALSMVTTILLTVLSTIVSAVISFFLALLAAQNLSDKVVSSVVKGFIALIRAIPTVLWVLIFTVAIGLGSAAVIFGVGLHSISYLTKAYSESFEEMDEGAPEALRAVGASYWQVVFQAFVPTTISKIFSWTFIRFEINFTEVVAVGAIAGAGGIGFQLFQAGSFYYSLHEVGIIVYCCLAVAFVLEIISIQLRKRFLVTSESS